MSLFELVISIGILATSILLVLGIFSGLVNGSQKSVDLTTGSVVAEGLLSQQIYQVMSDNTARNALFSGAGSGSTPEVYKAGTYNLNNVIYAYKIYVQDVSLGTELHSQATDSLNASGASSGSTRLKRMDIIVWWNDSSAQEKSNKNALTVGSSAQGQGVQQVHQVRLLWPGGPY